MATPEVMSFHNANALSERERVRLRIQQGTKASSPDVRSYRRQHLAIYAPHATLPDNSTGSKNRPFFATKDESHISLEDKVKMRGGVLTTPEGQKYAQFILKRRAKDIIKQDLEAQGVEPATVLPQDTDLVLTADESKSLELNNLLTAIDDAIEVGDVSTLTVQELKNIPRLLVAVLPTVSQSRLGELVDFVGDLIDKLEEIAEPDEDVDDEEEGLTAEPSKNRKNAERVLEFFRNILAFLREFAKVIGRDENTKRTALNALVKELFGVRKSTATSIIQRPVQKSVLDKRSAQPMASGEQRGVAKEVQNTNVLRRRMQIAPKPIQAPPPPPPEEAEAKVEEAEAPAVRRLTKAEMEFERRMDEGYKLAKSKVAERRNRGLAILREGAVALGKKVPAGEVSRTKLKNLIEKDTKYVLG